MTQKQVPRLPEILVRIGFYLDRHSLAASFRVCKEWHAIFVPYLYNSLHLRVDWNSPLLQIGKNPSFGTLKSYGDLVSDPTFTLPLPSSCELVLLTKKP